MLTEIRNGQTIYDVLLNTYKSLDLTYKLIQENPTIDSVDTDLDTLLGISVSWDETFSLPLTAQIIFKQTEPENNIASIIATEGQTLYDISLMTYGNLDNFYKMLQDSQIDNSDTSRLRGLAFNFDKNLINDFQYYKNLVSTGYIINTGDSQAKKGKSFDLSFDKSFE